MRDYIFRGKRKDNGQWTCGDLIQLLGEQGQGRKFIVDNRFGACIDNEGNFMNTEAPFVNEVDPETVGQFTGLKDRNGKDIYEGDIVQDSEFVNGAVVFQEGCFQAIFSRTDWDYLHEIVVDVIGNIYENPELWR